MPHPEQGTAWGASRWVREHLGWKAGEQGGCTLPGRLLGKGELSQAGGRPPGPQQPPGGEPFSILREAQFQFSTLQRGSFRTKGLFTSLIMFFRHGLPGVSKPLL